MTLSTVAKFTGYFFILIGILGFIPRITEHELLLGVFHINTAHNLFHVITGLVALEISRKGQKNSRHFFQIAGIAYLITGLFGFALKEAPVFGVLANNAADNWLNLALSIVFLYLGFLFKNPKFKNIF